MMTERICKINWVLDDKVRMKWRDVESIGCWKLLAYNTDSYMSSGVYQNQNDQRCTLALSGYHGKLTGPMRAIFDTVQIPPKRVEMCGNSMYEPFVKLIQRHTSLSNWSSIASVLGGRQSTCTNVTLAAESLGGSAAEILATCANSGSLAGLQAGSLPPFQVQNLVTFGSIAASTRPLENPLHSDGCFPGMRIVINGDMYAGMGRPLGLRHPRMDVMEIFHTQAGISRRISPCLSEEATSEGRHKPPPAAVALMAQQPKNDITNHEITTYKKDLRVFHNISWEDKGSPEAERPGGPPPPKHGRLLAALRRHS